MRNLHNHHVVITSAGDGLGLAMAKTFLAADARVTAIARSAERLEMVRQLGVATICGDATDARVMNDVVSDVQPDILILNAGARLPMLPIDKLSWDDFSSTWNTDVKASLVGIQAALNTPMKPGSRVMTMSSGAATVMSSPYIAPESLCLSGGYIGAKRMVWYMVHQANAISRDRQLGIRFQTLLPCQLIPGTALGYAVASAYAEIEGVSPEQHVLDRYGSILEPERFGQMVADLVGDPKYTEGVAYGFRLDAGIMPLDLAVTDKRT